MTFDETFCSFSTAELSTENDTLTNSAGPRGEVKHELDGKIHLPTEQDDDVTPSPYSNISSNATQGAKTPRVPFSESIYFL